VHAALVIRSLHTDMWKSVVNSINLSEQQKLNIVQWKQLFMQKVRAGSCDR
jgi:hypothetical protein